MLKVYTGQVGRYRGPDSLNITIASSFASLTACGFTGEVTQEAYQEWYLGVLRESYKKNREQWQELLRREQVALLCYCRPGQFCRRLILAEVLGKLGAEICGEIISSEPRSAEEERRCAMPVEFNVNTPTGEEKPGAIGPFSGQFRFLSNFFPSPVILGETSFPTVEHAFQAAKTLNPAERAFILHAPTPGQAKRAGRRVNLRPDWEQVKLHIMEDLVRQKFSSSPLKEQLIATYPCELIEINNWGDTIWGVCNGKGENHLGRILMKIRSELIPGK